ncbi:glycosyltransferase family 4 protein [Dactylosporangium sp. CS-047395]|uniref:glycosyltransferase family 4 protein n=1 Tax=Dactylosporangium sp. CS-047395 TaxID=3239936 RepID=UPI003D926779
MCTTGGSGRRQFGGAEHFLVDMLPALVASGVDIVACTPDDATGAALREAGVPWRELGARSRIDLQYVRDLRQVIGELRPDVVCAHLLSAAMHCRAALRSGGDPTPLVVTLHSSLWQTRGAAPTLKAKARVQANITLDLIMRRVRPHTTVAVSEYEAGELRDRGKVKDIRVIPNPLPPAWPAPQPAPERAPGEPPVLGYLGRLEPEKGAGLLGDVARALPDARLLVGGSGSVAVPPLPNVELLGQVDAAKFLPTLDCLLVPSSVEAFGKSAQEALSLGVPVVHSGVGGLAEVTHRAAGVLAFVAEPRPDAIAAAVRTALAATPPSAERLAIAHWYQHEHAFTRAVHRWTDLYRSVSHVNA